MNRKITFANLKGDDTGFSIVEVIVAVAILAIVFTPIMQSFMVSSRTNSKSQRIQNATSVSEDIMELVKTSSIEDLYNSATKEDGDKYKPVIGGDKISKDKILFNADNAPEDDSGFTGDNKKTPYKITYTDIRATQGITYDVEVEIKSKSNDPNESYANDPETTTDASDINAVELPKLYDIQDSKDHAVLSWELNEYDEAAAELLAIQYANDKEAGKKVEDIKNRISTDGIKTTTVTLSGDTDIKVECNVKYEEKAGGNSLEYNVYTGNLKHMEKSKKNNGGPHVYLFYAMMPLSSAAYVFPNEVIDIVDNTTDTMSSGDPGIHNVYIMLQDDNDKIKDLRYDSGSSNLELRYNGVSMAKSTGVGYILPEDKTQWDLGNGEKIYTNFMSTDINVKQGRLYDEGAKNRVYYVTITTKEHGKSDVLATLTSTMEAGSEADD